MTKLIKHKQRERHSIHAQNESKYKNRVNFKVPRDIFLQQSTIKLHRQIRNGYNYIHPPTGTKITSQPTKSTVQQSFSKNN